MHKSSPSDSPKAYIMLFRICLWRGFCHIILSTTFVFIYQRILCGIERP
ncbi:hypothetical protein BIFPSEUDO_02404 [Bifidobacterium pseudocatenulatum DSM 20438 = JCM 1200 = LMG 10505]|uniref:Uncharacterized protein n=1 Tax=Bifidobacterium pseudocatenulatum DSM 20438 = JCM 1200 = LMG 10505 TaxID=547043 RepID=C0BPW5_BIFPS|nr:hypothetical protein BIFPSEUDO_02404 [Bifidobacterium pseudocatenulatum DSM 20438 = JCM 1200 = LMG 10505]